MFTQKHFFFFYRFLKSGLLVDFFFKKFFYYILFYFFFVNNILFSEKFLVEYNFLQFTKVINYLFLYLDYFSNENTYAVLGAAVFSLCLCVLIVVRFGFTQLQPVYFF